MNHAVIVSHGQPSNPDPAEASLADLAQQVADLLPDWQIRSATLASPGSLTRALQDCGPTGRAFPLFMSGGWFTRVHLPARLTAAGAPQWQVLEPLGCDARVHDLTLHHLRQLRPARVLLAAHGSFKSRAPSDIAHHLAARITVETGIPAQAAFIEQDPKLEDATGFGPDTACLPYFATAGDHVTKDIPAALSHAGFQGARLPAIGLAPEVPQIIAAAIAAGHGACAQACRWQKLS